jgi:CheY-like chemotaxis protein
VEALRILDAAATPVRAVVTDLNMPRMDGYELIRRIRGDQRLRNTPIIVVSADTDPATPERVAALGVDAFFPKPFSPAQVRRTLEQLLNGTKH